MTEEEALKLELMRMDLKLKTKQAFWETPRNVVIVMGAFGALVAALAGTLGYKIGQTPPPQPIVIQLHQ